MSAGLWEWWSSYHLTPSSLSAHRHGEKVAATTPFLVTFEVLGPEYPKAVKV